MCVFQQARIRFELSNGLKLLDRSYLVDKYGEAVVEKAEQKFVRVALLSWHALMLSLVLSLLVHPFSGSA